MNTTAQIPIRSQQIISKRLQVVLPVLVDPAQSRFVKGRRIADNIFLTQELMRGYHKSSSSPRCAMKVDIRKAYDNVRWEFLWDVLSSMNFHPTMIKRLQACVTTANYTLSLNGEATGYIMGQKGLWQGDPLSSYLFVLVMEILTCLLREKSMLPEFHFHWRCGHTKIINLCFADDLMIFCKGELSSITLIQEALTEFQALSEMTSESVKESGKIFGYNPSVTPTAVVSHVPTVGSVNHAKKLRDNGNCFVCDKHGHKVVDCRNEQGQ
ncbi:hypothetical protein RHSIM_Rhsim06G0099000 [Rhododendron simsii]|uniref:Reverse transcriptase domain-containing protein n=1 Tax=Rhododendron simsii TaxID=118357 RepID=A0A834LNS3_RHOSS|nr:hypothetical protein RHSIM_Rhsim06G0099000 [Rhododendron simsii]